jgi:lysine/ornithine N-monooxygenase
MRGQGRIPKLFQSKKDVMHSARNLRCVKNLLPKKHASPNVGVVAGRQLAVEIFENLYMNLFSLMPNLTPSYVNLRFKASDDSLV